MQPIDGSYQSVKENVKWTVEELLQSSKGFLLYADFDERRTFDLFQEPTIGWMTTKKNKLGHHAQKLTFKYSNNSVELISCEGNKLMSLTAVKVATLITQLFNDCIYKVDFKLCRNPQDSLESHLTLSSVCIDRGGLEKFSFRNLFNKTHPSDFFVGKPYFGEALSASSKDFHKGDLVVIQRSDKSLTFGKINDVGSKKMVVDVHLDTDPRLRQFKIVSAENNPAAIFGHWSVENTRQNTSTETPLKKLKIFK